MARLEGKTALVVGAGGGIGRAGAELLAREGASVVCADVNGAAVSATVDSITRAGGRASSVVADVTAMSAAEALAQAPFDAFGALDVLIYSAGATATANILEHSRADWDRVIAVNLTAAFLLGQAVARRMVAQARGGSMVFVTSQLAHAAVRDKAAYLASKGGLRSLTMGMALDLAPHGIRVNAVAPGPVLTGFTARRAGRHRRRHRVPRERRSALGHRYDDRGRRRLSGGVGGGDDARGGIGGISRKAACQRDGPPALHVLGTAVARVTAVA